MCNEPCTELQKTDYSPLHYANLLDEKGILLGIYTGGEASNLQDKSKLATYNRKVLGLSYDSRTVETDTMFICKGAHFSVTYLTKAANQGACCYVSENVHEALELEIPGIIVTDIREAMYVLAAEFFNHPERKLELIGVTGTKGKSTVVHYIKSILDAYLYPKFAGLISTIRTIDGLVDVESHLTTPESVELYRHLYNAVQSGLKYVVLEVSSQALKYKRVAGLSFSVGIFVNISEDHISPNEHSDYQDYLNSKLKLIDMSRHMLICRDSAEYELLSAKVASRQKAYVRSDNTENDKSRNDQTRSDKTRNDKSTNCKTTYASYSYWNSEADFYAENIEALGAGQNFTCCYEEKKENYYLNMLGNFNVENALAALAVGKYYSVPEKYLCKGLEQVQVAGRMNCFISEDEELIILVDYAHNKLSFERLFQTIEETYPDRHICVVFSCGGNKGLGRREELGIAAARTADSIVLTSEDPGYEDPASIAKEIAKYIEANDKPYTYIEDRREALMYACDNVPKNSLIAVLGKGNEAYQKIADDWVACPSDIDNANECIARYNRVK